MVLCRLDEAQQGHDSHRGHVLSAVSCSLEDAAQGMRSRVLRSDILLAFACIIEDTVAFVDGFKQELAVSLAEYASEGSPQVASDYSRGRGGGQIDDLEQFPLDVYLMRRRTICIQGLDMARKIRCESQEVQVLLFGGQRMELLDVELGVRGVFPGGLLVGRRHW